MWKHNTKYGMITTASCKAYIGKHCSVISVNVTLFAAWSVAVKVSSWYSSWKLKPH